MRPIALSLSFAVALTVAVPNRAEACGGFFCSQVPVDQSGERIIFSVTPSSVEAHVQISYSGDAKSFSWVVPTEAKPEISIGSPTFFQLLGQVTQPRFNLQWTDSQCGGRGGFRGVAEASTFAGVPQDAGQAPEVVVVSQEEVGPYDAAILQATDANALFGWLTTHGYDLTPQGQDAIRLYVQPQYHFVALKLQKDKGVGDLRPIVLKMPTTRPCIPIRLTAVAATPDMPITAYVFANARAVPQNYRHVLVNQTKIDWLNFGSNYNQLATDAVDEAGGHAFLTEYAGKVEGLRPSLSQLDRGELWDVSQLATKHHPVDFLAEMLRQGFPRDSSIQNLLRKYVPLPSALAGSVSESVFYNRISSYRSEIDNDPNRPAFDAAGFAKELDETIVQPLRHAKRIVEDQPYLTRLFTTMSAAEMTVDPEFQFNSDVPDVTNLHTAKATPICNLYDPEASKVRIELADGRYFYVSSQSGPILYGPSAERIEQIPQSGDPIVIQDNTATIAQMVTNHGGGTNGSADGCASTGLGGGLPWGLLALGWLSRRRR